MRLEFGKSHLDRVKIGRVGWQEEKPGTSLLETLRGSGTLMDGEIVENDDVAARQRRGELGFNPGIKSVAVDGLIDDPWRCQLAQAQAGNECLLAPMPERGISVEPLATQSTPAKPYHFRGDRGLVDKNETMRLKPHPGLAAVDPEAPLSPDVGACGFRCQ